MTLPWAWMDVVAGAGLLTSVALAAHASADLLAQCRAGHIEQRRREVQAVLAACSAQGVQAEPEGTGGECVSDPSGIATGAPVEGSNSPRSDTAGEVPEEGRSAGD
jgi:hypothetical protein